MSLAIDLQHVCGRLDRREISREAFVSACTRLTTLHVGCTRAGIWTFLDSAEGPMQHCLGVYDALIDRMIPVPDFAGLDPFIDTLVRDGHVMVDDVHNDPSVSDLWHKTLKAHRIESVMATPFAVNGRLTGTFTCSQSGERMHWTSGQLAVLKRIANRASLSLASATSFTLTTLPAPLMEMPPLTGRGSTD